MTAQKALKIYVAGPMTARGADVHDAPRVMYQNVQKGIDAGIELLKKGHNPFIPHVTFFIHLQMKPPFPKDYPYTWYRMDNEWIRCCDALFYLAPSKGADAELALAKELGLKIFYSLDEVPVVDGFETQDTVAKVE